MKVEKPKADKDEKGKDKDKAAKKPAPYEELIKKGIEMINEVGEEKLSLRRIAKMCGVSPTTINLIRTGNGLGYRKTLRKIAKVLKVNANEIGD